MITDLASLAKEKPQLYTRLRCAARNRQAHVHLLMENVDKPLNLGAIARTCDALGIQHIHYLPTKRHEREKHLLAKTSVSASQWLHFTPFSDIQQHLTQRQQAGWHIIATTPDPTATSLYDFDFTAHHKLVLAVGSEAHGLSNTTFEHAHTTLTIPTAGIVQSLNVSVATAILLAEICRQRQHKRFLLKPTAQDTLIQHWIRTTLTKKRTQPT